MREKDRSKLYSNIHEFKFVDGNSGHMKMSGDMVFQGRDRNIRTTKKWYELPYMDRPKPKQYKVEPVGPIRFRELGPLVPEIRDIPWERDGGIWEEDGPWEEDGDLV